MIESDLLDKNSCAGMALGARWHTPVTDLNKRQTTSFAVAEGRQNIVQLA
jgi:hypothetical protein